MVLPSVALSPAAPALAQIVRSSRLAPSAWKKRRSMLPYDEQAHVAGVGVRQDRLRRRARAIARGTGRRSVSSASSQEMRAKRPSPLRPHAPHRVQDALGAVDALEVLVHLGAEEALREAVVGVAADRHRAAVLDLDRHHAGVGAVVRADDLRRAAPAAGRRRRHALMPSLLEDRPGSAALDSTATSTTSASVTFTCSPLPAPQRSASTATLTVIDVRPTRRVSV